MFTVTAISIFSKPTAMLRGHSGPITKLTICETEGRVYTISTDKTVKVSEFNVSACFYGLRTDGFVTQYFSFTASRIQSVGGVSDAQLVWDGTSVCFYMWDRKFVVW